MLKVTENNGARSLTKMLLRTQRDDSNPSERGVIFIPEECSDMSMMVKVLSAGDRLKDYPREHCDVDDAP